MNSGLLGSNLALIAQTKYSAVMKDILFIGGPKTVQGVDRINDDLMSILSAEGLYDRKAVVVWPTSDFLALPSDSKSLADVCDQTLVELVAIIEKGLALPEGYTDEDYRKLVVDVRKDSEVMDSALVVSARSQAFALLSKLVLALAGGQSLVAVVSKSTPVSAMRWASFPERWSDGQSRAERSCKSSEPGYGVLNAVGSYPLVYHGFRSGSVKAGDLVPRKPFLLGGTKVYYDRNSYFGVEHALDVDMEITFPVTDRFGSARAIKVSTDSGYMLVVPEPAKLKNFIIGLKTTPAAKPKGVEVDAVSKPSKVKTDQYMTRKEVADLLKMAERTVDRRIADRKLESTKVGSKVLITKASVDKLLEG